MTEKTFKTETKVLTITWYIPDNWYGKHKRVILVKDENTGFVTAKEAKVFNSQFKQYVKQKYNKSIQPVFASIAECPTYIYRGVGPSYSCTNIFITPSDLEVSKTEYEKTSEFRERQEKAQQRRDIKEFKVNKVAKRLGSY